MIDSAPRSKSRFGRKVFTVLVSGWVSLACSQAADRFLAEEGWKSLAFDTYESLREGTLENAGANLFLSRKGVIGPIHSWDFNADGYADIIFNNSHDHAFEIPVRIYRNEKGVADPEKFSELPASGGSAVAVADLNKDGVQDIVVAMGNNNTTGHQPSVIYWGDREGGKGRTTKLLTLRGGHVTVEDLNGDGHLDLVFSNRGDKPGEDKESFVYWGDGKDFSPERRTNLRTNHAMASVAVDWDRDGHRDLIFANRGSKEDDGSVILYRGAKDGLRNYRVETLGTQRATDLAQADLDGDGWDDVVVSDLRPEGKNESGIFYGGADGKARFVRLPAPDASACAVGDFDGDGKLEIAMTQYRPNRENDGEVVVFRSSDGRKWAESGRLAVKEPVRLATGDANGDGVADLAVAEQRDGQSKTINSHLFLGGKAGLQQEANVAYPTFGAADALVADVNGDKKAEVIFVNWSTGRSYGDIDSFVYWGNQDYAYSTKSRTDLPTIGGYNSVMTDFNGDGITDVLLVTSGEDDPKDFMKTGSFIYWGSKDGLSVDRRLALPEGARGFGATTADLNQDGFLDIVFGDLYGPSTKILYGSEKGFQPEGLKVLGGGGSFFLRAVDLNRDGLLDIVTPRIEEHRIVIFWNSPEGFHDTDISEIFCAGPGITEFADLNADGWLDMVVTGFYEAHSLDHRSNSAVYWGGPDGYSNYNRTILPMSGSDEAAVADLNRDGFLDIVFSNYHGNSTRIIDSYIYWGNGKDFSQDRRTALPTHSAAGNLVMDLNEDGWPDIVFSNHNLNNDHHTDSMIYWGSPKGYSTDKVTWLPAVGPHQMADVDAGNLYTRALEEHYESPVIARPEGTTQAALTWNAETPRGTSVSVQVRAAKTKDELASEAWSDPVTQGADLANWKDHPFWQYRVTFHSQTGAAQARLLGLNIHYRATAKEAGGQKAPEKPAAQNVQGT